MPASRLVTVAEAQVTVETAIALLKELSHRDLITFANDLREKRPQSLALLEWLERHLSVLQDLNTETQVFILWA